MISEPYSPLTVGIGMVRIEKFMYIGEKALFSMSGGSYMGREELSATNRRIIHVKGDKFYDIKYEGLMSLGIYSVYDWKWALAAVLSILLALCVLGMTMFVPLKYSGLNMANMINMLNFVGSMLLILALVLVAVFFLGMKSGIIMETPREKRCFKIKRDQRAEAMDFIKIVRAAEAGIVKAHRTIDKEASVVPPEEHGLEVIKALAPETQKRLPPKL